MSAGVPSDQVPTSTRNTRIGGNPFVWEGSFGANYGTLIKDMRIESRAIFVIDQNNTIRHAEYVKEVADFPNYEAALSAAKNALAAKA